MLRMVKAVVSVVGAIILGMFAVAIALEWAIWALWFAPGVLGLYLFFGERFQGIAVKYLAALLLVLSWGWATLLSNVLLPGLSRAVRYVLNMPFNPDESGIVDGIPYLLLGLLSVVGWGVFAHVAGTQASWALASRKQRLRRYKLIVCMIAVFAVGFWTLLGHPVVAGFAAFAALAAIAINTADTEDPLSTMTQYAKVVSPTADA
jgi:hypothetical protein